MSVSLDQAHETNVTLKTAGATSEFWTRIAQNLELAKAVVALVMNFAFRLVPTFDRDMSGEGWKLEKDSPEQEGEFTPELMEFLSEGESRIVGTEMERRVKDEPIVGHRHLEAMLRNQQQIPKEWRKYVLVAPGTVWLSRHGGRYVPYLCWLGERWSLDFYWLDSHFDSDLRVVRLRK